MRKMLKRGVGIVLAAALAIAPLPTFRAAQAFAAEGISFTEVGGYAEGAYAEFTTGLSAKGYNAYVKKSSQADSAYVKLDNELIRVYPDYIRVDAVGLEAGDYVIKIVPVYGGTEKPSEAAATAALSVYSHDRTGFAWVDGTASGAYNEDGTLKSNAVVVYVTEETKDKVSATVSGTVCSGVQNILTAYKKAKTNAAPLDIRIIGNITDPAVLDKGDLLVDGVLAGLTIEGIGEDATANGWGIRIKGSSNVEVRNLGIMNVNSGEGDNIGLQQNNNHVWVHNCDFFYGHAGSDADQVKGDGALDTKTSTFITHSYNHFYDNGKCNLQGMKSEKETNYITYHHNWYDHSDSRHPRIRTCSVHSYNNYFDGNAKYGVGVTMGASAFVENNYFRNCKYPVLSSGQGSDKVTGGTFSGETGGIVKTFNNYIEGAKAFVTYQDNNTEFDAYAVSSADEQVPSSVKTLSGGTAYNNFDTSSIMYSYTAQSPEDAKAAVVARAGRVNGGDFKYDFSGKTYQQKDGNGVMQTVTADEYYHVDDELKALVVNYKTSLVAVGGNPLGGGGSTTPVKPTKPSESETKSTEAGTEVSGSTGSTDTTKPSTNPGTTTGSYVHNFTASGTTSSVYTIPGSLANKGTVNYAGLTLSKCLKMESSTSIKFATPSSGKLILVFGGSTAASGKAVKVNGTKYTCGSDGIATIDISGSKDITITKGDSINLFYINYVTEGSSENPSNPATKPSTEAPTQKPTEAPTQKPTQKPTEAPTQAPTKPADKKNGLLKSDDGSWYYYVDDAVDTSKTGLVQSDDAWWYVESGKLQSDYKGFVENSSGKWYVVSGKINTDFTGLGKDGDDWLCVRAGKVDSTYTGLVKNSDYFWYVKDGKLDTTYLGTVTNDGGTWFIINGKLDTSVTGIKSDKTDFWYVKGGKVDTAFEGVVEQGGSWWYIKDGKVAKDYKGLFTNAAGTWYVAAGKIDTDFTGLGKDGDNWVCVRAGKVDRTYTGLVQSSGIWWYVSDGVLDTSYTGIQTNDGGSWLVVKGKLNTDYTGEYTVDSTTYNIVNGKVTD